MESIKVTSMTISWQPRHDLKGIIRGYQVSYTPHGESEYHNNVAGYSTSIELTGLRQHTEYSIRVRAKVLEYGEYSTPITASTLEDGESIKCTTTVSNICVFSCARNYHFVHQL